MLSNNKPGKNIVKAITIAAILCVLLFISIIIWKLLYINLNPDRIDLSQGNWEIIFSFTTHKGTDVRLFGRKGKVLNSGEFVIVRNWPFIGIQLISPIFYDNHIWEIRPLYPFKGYEYGEIYQCNIDIGHFFGIGNLFKYKLAPSLSLVFYQNRITEKFYFFALQYMNCDGLPVLDVFKTALEEPEINYGCKNPTIHNNPLKTIPF